MTCYELLCRLISDSHRIEPQYWPPAAQWEWEQFFSIASNELILPLIYNRLDPSVLEQNQKAQEALKLARDLNEERNKQILEEACYVAELANQLSIEPVALKGVASLLTGLYQYPSDRFIGDIDMLVSEKDVKPLCDSLLANGFKKIAGAVGVDCHHEMPMRRPGKPMLEIHRKIGMGGAGSLLTSQEIIDKSIQIFHGRAKLRIPSEEHRFLHHVIHTQLCNSYRKALWPDLRDTYDFVLLKQRLVTLKLDIEALKRSRKQTVADLITIHLLTMNEIVGIGDSKQSNISPFTLKLRWMNRHLQRSSPRLRLLNPYFLFRSLTFQRFDRIRTLAKTHEGRMYLFSAPLRLEFYRHLLKDLR